MNNPLYLSGITPDGIPLMAGIYRMKDEIGFPISVSYEMIKDNQWCPDWCEFLADAGRQKDWKLDDALHEMKMLVGEHLTAEIFEKFKFYGATIWTVNGKNQTFAEVCNQIVELKRKNGIQIIDTRRSKGEGQGDSEL